VVFADGARRVIDFKPFLRRFPHPDYDKYQKVSGFKRFKVIDGNIDWDDDTMSFNPESLYAGKI
jgi:hypothetical protein